MKTSLTLRLTAADIRDGLPRSSCFCPFAIAARRLFPRRSVLVSSDTIHLTKASYSLSVKAVQAIRRYDNGRTMKPGTFKLTLSS